MSLEKQIQIASARNDALLQTLAATDYAKPTLKQHSGYMADLETQLKSIDLNLRELDTRRTTDLKEHKKYRDSVVRRFAYKASGRRAAFEEKAAKEEKEYFETLQKLQTRTAEKETVQGLLRNANAQRANLEADAARHDDAQRELDGLYDSIFSGPSADHPDEDQLEYNSSATLQAYDGVRQFAEAETRGLSLLKAAEEELKIALRSLSSALGYSTWDMWGGGTMSDMMERNELSTAAKQWSAVQLLYNEARHATNGRVGPLPDVQVAMGNIMSDVFFDNIFTDMAFHDKIKQSDREMGRAASMLTSEIGLAEGRLKQAQADLDVKARELEQARKALQEKRTEIFRSIVGH